MGLEHLQFRCSVLSEATQAWHGRAKLAYCQYVDAARQSHAQVQPAQNATYGLKGLKWADTFRMLGRRILVVALVPYVLWPAFAYHYHLVDGVNLGAHEAGHMFFRFFGQTLHFFGGSIGQLVFPVAFVVHFARRAQWFEAAVGLAAWTVRPGQTRPADDMTELDGWHG